MNVIKWIRSVFSPLVTCPPKDDPVFGPLKVTIHGHDVFVWEPERRFTSHGENALVTIFGDEHGPTERERNLFVELQQRYPDLRKLVEEPLAAEYESIRQGWGLGSPVLGSPSDIWKVAHLDWIEIYREGHEHCDMVLHHSIDWMIPPGEPQDDHELNVAISEWRVVEVLREG